MSVFPCHSPKFLHPSNTNECLLSVPPPLLQGSSQKVQLKNFRGSDTAHVRSLFKDEGPVLSVTGPGSPAAPASRISHFFQVPPPRHLTFKYPSRCPLSSPFPLISGFCSILSQKIASKKEEYHGASMVSEVKCPGQPLWRVSQVGILCPYGPPCALVHWAAAGLLRGVATVATASRQSLTRPGSQSQHWIILGRGCIKH